MLMLQSQSHHMQTHQHSVGRATNSAHRMLMSLHVMSSASIVITFVASYVEFNCV